MGAETSRDLLARTQQGGLNELAEDPEVRRAGPITYDT